MVTASERGRQGRAKRLDAVRDMDAEARAAADLAEAVWLPPAHGSNDPDAKEVDQETRILVLESETDLRELMQAVVDNWHDLEAAIVGSKARKEKMSAREQRYAARIALYKKSLARALKLAKIKRMPLEDITLNRRDGGTFYRVKHEADVPQAFKTVKMEPVVTIDMAAVAASWKEGKPVPGTEEFEGTPTVTRL